jgi:hypothetical protein
MKALGLARSATVILSFQGVFLSHATCAIFSRPQNPVNMSGPGMSV